MNHPCTVAVLLSAIWASALHAESDALISTSEMRAYLERREQSLKGLVVHFDNATYFGRGRSNPPPNAETRTFFVNRKAGSFAASGRRYRLEVIVEDASQQIANMIGREEIHTFDGVEARRRLFHPNLPADHADQGQIGDAPFKAVLSADFHSWYGWWVLQRPERLSYLDLFTQVELEGPWRLPDGTTQWRVKVPGDDLSGVMFTARRRDSRVELAQVLYHGYRTTLWGDENDLNVAMRIAFGATEPSQHGYLASSAVVTGMHFRARSEDGFWGMSRLSLRSVQPLVESATTFRVPFSAGAHVTDSRYGLVYRLGTTGLVVDGRLLRTAEPLEESVGDRLEWWVAHGRWVPTATVRRDASHAIDGARSEQKSRRPTSRLVFVLLIVLALATFVVFVLRGRRGRFLGARIMFDTIATVTLATTAGCFSRDSSARPDAPAHTLEMGEVSLDRGPQLISHDFRLTNAYSQRIEVIDIKPTCSCLTTSVGKTTLAPGESTILRLEVRVRSPGKTVQGATVILSNGRREHFSIAAIGMISRSLQAFVRSAELDPVDRDVSLRAYLVFAGEQVVETPLSVLEPPNVAIASDNWIILERGSIDSGRPTRQVANLSLDFSRYEGAFPVDVTLTSQLGAQCTVVIYGPLQATSSTRHRRSTPEEG